MESAFDDALLYVALSMIVWRGGHRDVVRVLPRDPGTITSSGRFPLGTGPLGAAKLGALAVDPAIFVSAANAIPIALVPA